jgi:tRNA (guanine-N7-)-methyltransferase
LIKLRAGETLKLNPHNPYLFEAVGLRDMLYTFPELEEGFPSIFEDMDRPLVLDVGCYFGNTTVELALNNPGINVLGLDVKYKRVVKSCRKIRRAKLTNAKVAICDIRQLPSILPGQSLDGLCVFFPDPWRKSRHEKFRYMSLPFFNCLYPLMRDNGFIWFKTDNKDYFDEVSEAVKKSSFGVRDGLPENSIVPLPYKTLFEELFIRQDLDIHQMIMVKE